jgi:hypothetical protein
MLMKILWNKQLAAAFFAVGAGAVLLPGAAYAQQPVSGSGGQNANPKPAPAPTPKPQHNHGPRVWTSYSAGGYSSNGRNYAYQGGDTRTYQGPDGRVTVTVSASSGAYATGYSSSQYQYRYQNQQTRQMQQRNAQNMRRSNRDSSRMRNQQNNSASQSPR